MVETESEAYFVVLLWFASLALLLAQAWRGWSAVVGLSLTYWLNLAMIHLLGGLIQLLPWHTSPARADSIAGFCLTGYALVGLLLGNMLIAPWLFRHLLSESKPPRANLPTRRLAIQYIMIGLI